jgi:branched-chain amino acid transport system substrate-binding protein
MTLKNIRSSLVAVASIIATATATAATIGLVAPLSGPQAVLGQDQVDGFMLAIELLGGKLGDRPVTVLREDDQLKPEIGNQIVRKFIDKDKVDAIVGLGFSNVLMASLPRISESGIVAIATNAGPSLLAGASCKPNVFSVAWQNDGAAESMGKFAQEKGVKRIYLMAPNYQAGRDMLAGFKRFFKGDVVDEVYTQINQPDYSAEIAQLQAAKPDAVFVFYTGGMGVNFVKQMSQAGMLGMLPLYSAFTVDATTMPSLREAAVGTTTGTMWDAVLDLAANRRFVAAFETKYRRIPSPLAATGFDAANLLDAGLRKVNGDTSNKAAFAAAVKAAGSEFHSVRGPFRFNNNNMPIQNYHAFEVLKDGGKVVVKHVGTPLEHHQDAYHGLCPLK